jgi:hypothetical protein
MSGEVIFPALEGIATTKKPDPKKILEPGFCQLNFTATAADLAAVAMTVAVIAMTMAVTVGSYADHNLCTRRGNQRREKQ